MAALSIEKEISELFLEALKRGFEYEPDFEVRVDVSPEVSFGDFTVACFAFAQDLGRKPEDIAQTVAELIYSQSLEAVEAVGPYVNIRVKSEVLFESVLTEVLEAGDKYGSFDFGKGKRVMVEYLSPNTNKPLHLGHIRNGALGMAISNLLEATGHTVVKANLINDRGVHICKSMLAYEKWGEDRTPESEGIKGDHFVGDMYVLYSKKEENETELEKEVQEMLRKWESGDPRVMQLWETMNKWVYAGFAQTYDKLGLKFDIFYYESKTYKSGKEIVEKGLEKGVLRKLEDGAVVAQLPIEQFGKDDDGEPKKITLLRSDGTSVYMTQDLGTAVLKFEEHKLSRSIYVVGNEQTYHFKALFAILDMLGYSWAKDCHHLSHAMVYLPEGKLKSREGKIVDADALIDEMASLAKEEINKRAFASGLSQEEIETRALAIGVSAIKFYLLRITPNQDIHFNPRESISFDGATGPYCQYAYARARSILRNAAAEHFKPEFGLLGNKEERELIKLIIKFPEAIRASVETLEPSHLCNHVYETAQAFSSFYQEHRVLSSDLDRGLSGARLKLVETASMTLKKGLELLGIEPIEQM